MSYLIFSYRNHIRSKRVVKVVIIFISLLILVFENGVFHSQKNVNTYSNDLI